MCRYLWFKPVGSNFIVFSFFIDLIDFVNWNLRLKIKIKLHYKSLIESQGI